MGNRLVAEALGTFWIVFAGCGSALLSAALPQLGIGVFGIAFAFGLAVATAVYAVGHISGGHLNPAVSIALMLSRRFPASEVPAYIGAQVFGAIMGGDVLYLIASGRASPPTATASTRRPATRCWRASAPKWSLRSCSSLSFWAARIAAPRKALPP